MLTHGRSALSARELAALLLGTGGAVGTGAHLLAERLLARFGSLDELRRAHPADLMSVPGIGAAKAAALAAAFELGGRADPDSRPTVICSTADLAAAVAPQLQGLARERTLVVVCNNANRLLAIEPVSDGSVEQSLRSKQQLSDLGRALRGEDCIDCGRGVDDQCPRHSGSSPRISRISSAPDAPSTGVNASNRRRSSACV